jgi:hypothetical protein
MPFSSLLGPRVPVQVYQGDTPSALWDDNFTNGPQGWEELFQFASDWNTQRYLPITLSPHGKIGKYALKLQTNNTVQASYGGAGFALKRVSHLPQPGVANLGIVKSEFWFTMGSDAPSPTSPVYDSYAPRFIEFDLDSQYPTSVQTTVNDGTVGIMGKRAFFTARWLQSAQVSSNQTYVGQWYFSQGSGFAYGAGGYVSPLSTALVASGYYSNILFNQNKRSLQYVAITCDTFNGLWKSMQVNHLVYDLTRIPSLSNGPLTTLLAPNDPTYNIVAGDFAGGLNPIVEIGNVVNTGFATASFLELHRARGSYQ